MATAADLDQLMLAWFHPSLERRPLTEPDIRGITDVLERQGRRSWSRIPRIYSVLRFIRQLEQIHTFQGITDTSFPFSQTSLPEGFSGLTARSDFLEAQSLVFNTKAFDLEREAGKHGHFHDMDQIPFKKLGELGKGGHGYVDRVVSTISHQEYARKLIPRGRTFRKDKEVLRDFERELGHMKKLSLSHKHIVRLIGSYTDPKYVEIIMSPVADCNLHELLHKSPLSNNERSFLRPIFGCLASALRFLHNEKIRHKDIKPQNILVKDHDVFITDFGVSLDWTERGHSTTTGPTSSVTRRYCAPEVSDLAPRRSSADIWSLGCVYLEIWTVLKQQTLPSLITHLEANGTGSVAYHLNQDAVRSWISFVRDSPRNSVDNAPVPWIKALLRHKENARWSANTLYERIDEFNEHLETTFAFTGLCCMEDDIGDESIFSAATSDGEDANGAADSATAAQIQVKAPILSSYSHKPFPAVPSSRPLPIRLHVPHEGNFPLPFGPLGKENEEAKAAEAVSSSVDTASANNLEENESDYIPPPPRMQSLRLPASSPPATRSHHMFGDHRRSRTAPVDKPRDKKPTAHTSRRVTRPRTGRSRAGNSGGRDSPSFSEKSVTPASSVAANMRSTVPSSPAEPVWPIKAIYDPTLVMPAGYDKPDSKDDPSLPALPSLALPKTPEMYRAYDKPGSKDSPSPPLPPSPARPKTPTFFDGMHLYKDRLFDLFSPRHRSMPGNRFIGWELTPGLSCDASYHAQRMEISQWALYSRSNEIARNSISAKRVYFSLKVGEQRAVVDIMDKSSSNLSREDSKARYVIVGLRELLPKHNSLHKEKAIQVILYNF